MVCKMNLLQVAVMKKEVSYVEIMTKMAEREGTLDALLDYRIQNLNFDCTDEFHWIKGSQAIHIATWFDEKSLAHLLTKKPEQVNFICEDSGKDFQKDCDKFLVATADLEAVD